MAHCDLASRWVWCVCVCVCDCRPSPEWSQHCARSPTRSSLRRDHCQLMPAFCAHPSPNCRIPDPGQWAHSPNRMRCKFDVCDPPPPHRHKTTTTTHLRYRCVWSLLGFDKGARVARRATHNTNTHHLHHILAIGVCVGVLVKTTKHVTPSASSWPSCFSSVLMSSWLSLLSWLLLSSL